MYAKYISILVALLGTAVVEADDQFSDRQCGGDFINLDDCSTALQSSIPANAYTTTQGNLHWKHNGCTITVGDDNGHDILKTTLSANGQTAMTTWGCKNATNGVKPGSAIIPNSAKDGHFKFTWGLT